MTLPRFLIITGLFILIVSLVKIFQAMTNGPPEQPHYRDENYEDMELNWLNGRGNGYIPILTRLGR